MFLYFTYLSEITRVMLRRKQAYTATSTRKYIVQNERKPLRSNS